MLKKIILFSLLALINNFINAQISVGPNSPATAINGACNRSFSSTLAYSPANEVLISDNVYASATHCACCDQQTNCLIATDFGFNIPTGSMITGVTVEVEKRVSGFGAIFEDNEVQLLKGGVEVGSDYRSTVDWPSTDTYTTYGGCNNLWGTTWTVADINANNFGVAFAGIDYTCGGIIQSHVDHIRISVCYSITTDVETLSNTKFVIAPNPVSDYINLQSTTEFNSYSLHDFTGRIVTEGSVYDKRIEVANLPEGLYFLKLTDDVNTEMHKFIKK